MQLGAMVPTNLILTRQGHSYTQLAAAEEQQVHRPQAFSPACDDTNFRCNTPANRNIAPHTCGAVGSFLGLSTWLSGTVGRSAGMKGLSMRSE